MEQIRDQDFLLESLIIVALLSTGFMVGAGYLPNSLKNESAFPETYLSSSDLIFAIFISAMSVLLVCMVMDIELSKASWGCAISLLFSEEIELIISTLNHGHLHIWGLLKAHQSLVYSDVFSVNEVLVGLNALVSHHIWIWPVLTLNFREKSDTHKVDFHCSSVNSSYLSES